jgi:hypothetical protein
LPPSSDPFGATFSRKGRREHDRARLFFVHPIALGFAVAMTVFVRDEAVIDLTRKVSSEPVPARPKLQA